MRARTVKWVSIRCLWIHILCAAVCGDSQFTKMAARTTNIRSNTSVNGVVRDGDVGRRDVEGDDQHKVLRVLRLPLHADAEVGGLTRCRHRVVAALGGAVGCSARRHEVGTAGGGGGTAAGAQFAAVSGDVQALWFVWVEC